ncbi:MAG: TetR/AcrR family transcriptional regulator [Arthrobacter sp.]
MSRLRQARQVNKPENSRWQLAQRKTDRPNPQGERTRELILETAIALAARHGYEGTKVSMIRRATGLSASSIYWHFPDKDQLLSAALEHAFRVQAAGTPNWLDSRAQDPRCEDLFGKLLAFPPADEGMDYWRFGLQLAVVRPQTQSISRTRFLQIRAESFAWLGQWWERSLPEGMRRRQEAGVLMGRLTVAVRDSSFIRRHGSQTLDERWVTWLLAGCLDAAADRLAERGLPPGPFGETAAQSAPRPERSGEEPAGPRQTFLRAAEETIEEYGYGGVTVARVCEKAGLPASSLYWSFKDKDELLATVVASACRRWEDGRPVFVSRPADGNWSPVLKDVLLPTVAGFASETSVLRLGLLLLLQRGSVPEAERRHLEEVLQDMQDMTTQWFRTVLPDGRPDLEQLPAYLSECLFRLLEGLMLSRQIDGPPWDPELLTDLVCAGLFRAAALAGQKR